MGSQGETKLSSHDSPFWSINTRSNPSGASDKIPIVNPTAIIKINTIETVIIEIIGFFGNNSEDPYNLGGEIEFWLEDEKHIITRSSLIFVPGGMKHCPLILRRVDRPIFHFSTVTSGQYVLKEANTNK